MTSFQEILSTTGEDRVAIMMDDLKVTELILITKMMMGLCGDADRNDTEVMETKQ